MAASNYTHSFIELECLIKAAAKKGKKSSKAVKIKLPSKDDWEKNLKSILQRIPKKFKIIKAMNDSDWCLKIKNNDFIIENKQDFSKIGAMINSLKPPVMLQIVDSINTMTDNLINDMSVNEIKVLQSALNPAPKAKAAKPPPLGLAAPKLPKHLLRTQSSRTVRIAAAKPKVYVFHKNKGYKYKRKTPKTLKKKKLTKQLAEIKEDEDDDDELKSDDDNKDGAEQEDEKPAVNIEALLAKPLFLAFESIKLTDKLVELGTYIAVLADDKKKQLKNTLNNILEKHSKGSANKSKENKLQIFQMLLSNMAAAGDEEYVGGLFKFLALLGYAVGPRGAISGDADPAVLEDVASAFYHLSNAMQKPRPNIYDLLGIEVPDEANDISRHASGLNCAQFIVFELNEILLENQQSSLVDKSVLDPVRLERFMNFLVPGASKYKCKEIFFEKLQKLQVFTIGLFGTRREILGLLLHKFGAISRILYDRLLQDEDNSWLRPGIHAILPVDIQKGQGAQMQQWDHIIYLFYFSMHRSFDMKAMKAVKYMRKDPSCLLSRVLFEISNTVCINVATEELTSFGCVEEEDEKRDAAPSGKKKKKRKRRQKLNFSVEETKDNHIMATPQPSKAIKINIKSDDGRNEWKKFAIGSRVDVYSENGWFTAKITGIKLKSIQIHYIGYSGEYDEWLSIEAGADIYCDCEKLCENDVHLLSKVRTQTKYQHIAEQNDGKIDYQFVSNRKIREIASDSYLFGGNNLNGYMQLFKVEKREGRDQNTEQLTKKKDLIAFLADLNEKHILKWTYEFAKSFGIRMLAQAALKSKIYNTFKLDMNRINEQEKEALLPDTIQIEVDRIINEKNARMLYEFDKFYKQKYCTKIHQQILDIINALGSYVGDDNAEAVRYALLSGKSDEDDDDDDMYATWRDLIFENVEKEVKLLLTEHANGILKIKEETRKKLITADSAADKNDAITRVNAEEEIETRQQQNKTIEEWYDLYMASLREYKQDIYGFSSMSSRKTTKRQAQRQIRDKFDLEKQKLGDDLAGKIAAQQDKKDKNKMSSITLSKYKYTKNILLSKKKEEFYYITYLIPVIIPPSYYLQFTSIDLPDYDQNIRTSIMRNMQYEIAQTEDIIFNEMLSSGETIMFIQSLNEETKQSETKIIASNSRILSFETSPLKVLKKKKVILVAFCEAQKIFCILFQGQLAFCVFQDGGRISFTNKMCDLHDLAWYNKTVNFRALLMGEINKNLFVYLIDEYNKVRVFDYDANCWDTAKQFELDKPYKRYIIPPTGSFLLCMKPEYGSNNYDFDEDFDADYDAEYKSDDEKVSDIEQAKLDLITLKTCMDSVKLSQPKVFTGTAGYKSMFSFTDSRDTEWCLVTYVNKVNELIRVMIEHKNAKKNAETVTLAFHDWPKLYGKLRHDKLKDIQTPSGRVEVHAFLLSERRKLEYKVTEKSMTGYEMDQNQKGKTVDNTLLPTSFSIYNMDLNRIKFQEIKKGQLTVCCIDIHNKLYYHLLDVQISEARMKIQHQKKARAKRKITKLDYMEYMIEKFGSRAAVHFPVDAILALHTTYILKDDDYTNNNEDLQALCNNIADTICESLIEKESKDFKFFNWQCNALKFGDTTSAVDILKAIGNKQQSFAGDAFIQSLITQLPIQIARGANNKFQLQYNGSDDQTNYVKASDAYELCQEIRWGAYDGLIKSWEGSIKIVTSMGKQSTGKSYMLNHLFGTKFDISGGRCTDGSWLSCKIIKDTLFIICDFEGLGSFERSAQEDMLLATFNSAVSNCTIFKCDNRFDRTVEDMFNKFQSGVKIMSGSALCFQGELLLVIKDVVETGAEAAVADFNRHIERLAQESDVIINERGKKESSFFVTQMYKNGLSLVPYPPLANDAFFTEMQLTLKPAFDDIEVLHCGGKQFLDHVKLIMAKLNIGDWSAMSGEQARIRANEIRANLQNAVEAGCIIQPTTSDYGVTFEVDDDQNLLLLDGNKVIRVALKADVLPQIKNYQEVLDEYRAVVGDQKVEQTLLDIIDGLSDAGLILGKVESLKFLWQQFSAKIKRKHRNAKLLTNLYQLFLDVMLVRRKVRVGKYIVDNTDKFGDVDETDSLRQAVDSRLNVIRDKMKLCGAKCADCFYLCLLCKNHEDDEEEKASQHSCNQSNHSCREHCTYCLEESGHRISCGDKCGHAGKHNCRKQKHACGRTCSLAQYGGCQTHCNLPFGHSKSKQPCKCAAAAHFCVEKCAIAMCHNGCQMPYNLQHGAHLCVQSYCPYKCEVQVWNDRLQQVTDCGRPCSCDDHDHQLKMDSGECKDGGHTCNKEHPCPEACSVSGNCKVEITRLIVEKEVFETGAGSSIEYESFAEANGGKRRCHKKIAVGQFRHSGDDHKCYSGKASENIHSCDTACDSCGYFCQLKYGHYEDSGTFHDCVHGNMRNTRFYANLDEVDTGDGRRYKVGDLGVAEMCNIFCERLGRGHIHLEYCQYHSKGEQCVEEEGRRHQRQIYRPEEEKEKDEVKHGKFWRRKMWKDPCLDKYKQDFDLCPFVCQHISHREKLQALRKKQEEQKKQNAQLDSDKKEEAPPEEEEKKGAEDADGDGGDDEENIYCIHKLWHKATADHGGHSFECKHPFNNAHIIFLCDRNASMLGDDGGASLPTLKFIAEYKEEENDAAFFNNRLGSLYEAIYKFMKTRIALKCHDKCSAIVFSEKADIAADHIETNLDFVQNYLLKFGSDAVSVGVEDKDDGKESGKSGSNINLYAALTAMKKVVNSEEETIVVILCDASNEDVSDDGAAEIVKQLKGKMKNKLSLQCVTLGAEKPMDELSAICKAGNGKEMVVADGLQLSGVYMSIAKGIENVAKSLRGGVFMNL